MNKYLWRLELAWAMIRYGWGPGMALYVLRGNYDDPYYTSDPEDPVRGIDVLVEDASNQ